MADNYLNTKVGRHRKFTRGEEVDILFSYLFDPSNPNMIEVGEKFGCSAQTVNNIVRRHGHEPRPRHSSGSRHHSWKGGKTTNVHGYVLIRIPRSHHLDSMRTANGYALLHRVVMAESLGRPLLPTESVHHMDGDKTNNSLSNLQLRVGNHGKGVVLVCGDCGSHDIQPDEI